MALPIYYLSSLDYSTLEQTRVCQLLKFLHFASGNECALVCVDPPVLGQLFGVADDIDHLILAPRHEGYPLSRIREFPCFVHVARPRVEGLEFCDAIEVSDLEHFAWGELYRSRHDADNKVFD